MSRPTIKHISANAAASDRDDHQIFITDAADLVVTLPKSDHSSRGVKVTLVQRALSSGTGACLDPADADVIHGETLAGVAITGAAGKKLINTGATDVLGDTVTVVADGAGKWEVISILGIFAAEA